MQIIPRCWANKEEHAGTKLIYCTKENCIEPFGLGACASVNYLIYIKSEAIKFE